MITGDEHRSRIAVGPHGLELGHEPPWRGERRLPSGLMARGIVPVVDDFPPSSSGKTDHVDDIRTRAALWRTADFAGEGVDRVDRRREARAAQITEWPGRWSAEDESVVDVQALETVDRFGVGDETAVGGCDLFVWWSG